MVVLQWFSKVIEFLNLQLFKIFALEVSKKRKVQDGTNPIEVVKREKVHRVLVQIKSVSRICLLDQ